MQSERMAPKISDAKLFFQFMEAVLKQLYSINTDGLDVVEMNQMIIVLEDTINHLEKIKTVLNVNVKKNDHEESLY